MLETFILRNIFFISLFCSLFSFSGTVHAKINPEKVFLQAEKKQEAGDYEEAQKLYETILKDFPDHEPALMGLGDVQYWQGNYQGSIDTYAKILAHEPDHVKALVGTGKAYLALGKQRKAQEYFNRAEKTEPDNEEAAAIDRQLERKTKLTIEGGYITEIPSYASETQGEFQEVRISKERTYNFGLNSTFLRKFAQDAFNTKLFGSYYLLEDTRLDLALSFAPKTSIVPKQSYEIGLAQTLWLVTPEVHYLFEDFRQANVQTLRPALFIEPFPFVRVGGGYEFQRLEFGTVSRNFHGEFGQVKLTPLEWLAVDFFYERIERGFEAGRTPTPFVNYKANRAGGGIWLNFSTNYMVRFNAAYEDRNNNETNESYSFSFGYVF